jgi:hypothetical protein
VSVWCLSGVCLSVRSSSVRSSSVSLFVEGVSVVYNGCPSSIFLRLCVRNSYLRSYLYNGCPSSIFLRPCVRNSYLRSYLRKSAQTNWLSPAAPKTQTHKMSRYLKQGGHTGVDNWPWPGGHSTWSSPTLFMVSY